MGKEKMLMLMQVMANLARDPHCIIIVPKEKKSWICRTAYGCTVADESRCRIYIILGDTDHSLPALVNPPEITHDISIGRLSVLKYPPLYMLNVHLEAYAEQFLSAWTSFTGVQSGTAYITEEAIHFHSSTLSPKDNCATWSPETEKT